MVWKKRPRKEKRSKYDSNMFYVRPHDGCAECGNKVRLCTWSPSFNRDDIHAGAWICWRCYMKKEGA